MAGLADLARASAGAPAPLGRVWFERWVARLRDAAVELRRERRLLVERRSVTRLESGRRSPDVAPCAALPRSDPTADDGGRRATAAEVASGKAVPWAAD